MESFPTKPSRQSLYHSIHVHSYNIGTRCSSHRPAAICIAQSSRRQRQQQRRWRWFYKRPTALNGEVRGGRRRRTATKAFRQAVGSLRTRTTRFDLRRHAGTTAKFTYKHCRKHVITACRHGATVAVDLIGDGGAGGEGVNSRERR